MEFNCAHVVHMACQSEHALLDFVVPDFDEVVIAITDEHGLRLMEINASYRSYIQQQYK